jgi:glyoxylase-like metal-dependent hydrolase (beta-lactamase superfamily II)
LRSHHSSHRFPAKLLDHLVGGDSRGAVPTSAATWNILAAAEDEGVHLTKILLTHAHIDHAGATQALAELRGLPIEGPHPDDQFWIDMLPEQARMFGFAPVAKFTPTRWLAQGDTVKVGPETLEVYHCPGHTPGHVVFFSRPDRLAFVGDVLFAGSIGRTDFPRGDHATLLRSIASNLWPLGDDVTFVPGHGPTSTFGQERATNPFVGGSVARPDSHFGN